VEVRYPFLDEAVFDFLAPLHPDLKLRGFRDKHLLRELAARWVPESVYKRRKVIFRAPLDSFHMDPEPPYVAQLVSEESLRKTGYFDPAGVRKWRQATMEARPPRLSSKAGWRRSAGLPDRLHARGSSQGMNETTNTLR
jgi:asparagine synthase (glutamine-hydrolysing)